MFKFSTINGIILSAIFGMATLSAGQVRQKQQVSDTQKAALAAAEDLMKDCELSRKQGRLDRAESQCRAAIQTLRDSGFSPQGETFTLGIILFDKGVKREGFTLMVTAFGKPVGGIERELYLGRAALELGEYKVAQEIVDYYRRTPAGTGSLAVSTREYWPAGNDLNSITATLAFLEGSRLNSQEAATKKAIAYFQKANKLTPKNIAISFALGMTLASNKEYKESLPLLKFVADRGVGQIQRSAFRRYSRLKDVGS